MSKSIMYICLTTTTMLADRSMIAPGTPFRGEDVVPATLESMLKNKTVQVFSAEKPPTPLPKYRIGKTDLRPKKGNEEIKEASNIGMHRRPPEIQTTELDVQKALIRAKLKALGITMPHNARLDTLEDRLKKEQAAAIEHDKKTGTVGPALSVWDADPVELTKIPMDKLLTVYRDQAEKHEIPLQEFATKELLIEYMSSQFVKK